MDAVTTARPGLAELSKNIAAIRSLAFPHKTCDERGREDDVPHLELIDRTIASLQEARKALDLHRPNFAKADGFIEEAGRQLRELEDLPCGGGL